MTPPPWRWSAFATITSPAGYVDLAARDLLMAAMRAADGVQEPGAAPQPLERSSSALGVSKRTLVRARVWLRENAPELFATLAPRPMDGARVVAARWAKRRAE